MADKEKTIENVTFWLTRELTPQTVVNNVSTFFNLPQETDNETLLVCVSNCIFSQYESYYKNNRVYVDKEAILTCVPTCFEKQETPPGGNEKENLESAKSSVSTALNGVLVEIDGNLLNTINFYLFLIERATSNLSTTTASYLLHMAIRLAGIAGVNIASAGEQAAGSALVLIGASMKAYESTWHSGLHNRTSNNIPPPTDIHTHPTPDSSTLANKAQVFNRYTTSFNRITKVLESANNFHSLTQIIEMTAEVVYSASSLASMVGQVQTFITSMEGEIQQAVAAATSGKLTVQDILGKTLDIIDEEISNLADAINALLGIKPKVNEITMKQEAEKSGTKSQALSSTSINMITTPKKITCVEILQTLFLKTSNYNDLNTFYTETSCVTS